MGRGGTAFINITSMKVKGWDGAFSIPGIRGVEAWWFQVVGEHYLLIKTVARAFLDMRKIEEKNQRIFQGVSFPCSLTFGYYCFEKGAALPPPSDCTFFTVFPNIALYLRCCKERREVFAAF